MERQDNLLKNLDWITIGLYLLLVLAGWVNIYAAVYNEEYQSILSLSQNYGRQLLWIGLSLVAAGICLTLDAKFYSVLSYPIYILVMLSLLAVPFLGEYSHGARSWFSIGPFKLQPSEFAKTATSLAMARFISSRPSYGKTGLSFRHLLMAGVLIVIPPALIMLQPDMGSCLVYVSFLLVLYRAGMPFAILGIGILAVVLFILSFLLDKALLTGLIVGGGILAAAISIRKFRPCFIGVAICTLIMVLAVSMNESMQLGYPLYLVMMVGAGAVCLVLGGLALLTHFRKAFLPLALVAGSLVFITSVDTLFDKLDTHQQERIEIMLHLKEDPYGVGYNTQQSLIAIGSGRLTGRGFLQGTQTKFDFVPEQSTDFIFCTIGEEWGFLGTCAVVTAFVVLLLRLITLAERQRSAFSQIYGYCVVAILFFHFFINIGMVIGLLPVIGIPLPFFSYGGSSLLAFTILIFIMLRLDASRREYFS
ncbi:MAG: rod shape-determining protein RodA [Bacteroidales bacterium]|nr:rod shape-determining protein RodA [Bacteroidales bacterium]MBR0222968.1 rod shape-determining protein RodA [Bacteroidales bacterium]